MMQDSEELMRKVRDNLRNAYEASWWADHTDHNLRLPFKDLALKCEAMAIMKLSVVVRQQSEAI